MTMTKLELAELELRRSQDRYEAALSEEKADKKRQSLEQGGEPQMGPPPLTENQRVIDATKITCIEDFVALWSILGFRVVVDINNPAFETVEHLVADDVNPETTEE
jgi:hypothetical protein